MCVRENRVFLQRVKEWQKCHEASRVPNMYHGRHVGGERRQTRPETARPATQAATPRPAWRVLDVSSMRATPRSKAQSVSYATVAAAAAAAARQ